MCDLSDSGIGVGRWLGIPVRMDVSWIVLALFVLFVTTHGPGAGYGLYGALCLVLWFASVVWHEAWHCVAVARGGGVTESILLTPVGGLARCTALSEPKAELFAASAGCLGNVVGMVMAGSMIYALTGTVSILLLDPLYPVGLIGGDRPVLAAMNMAFWINWVLLLVNVMPTAVTDGGRLLNSLMWSYRHQRQLSDGFVLSATLIVTLGLVVAAIVLRDAPQNVAVPAWLPLSALALFLGYYAARGISPVDRESASEEESFGYDFSQGYTSLDRQASSVAEPPPGLVGNWLERRRQRKQLERQHQAHEDELRADVILGRLHREGLEALTAEERALLDRVSARYRDRIDD